MRLFDADGQSFDQVLILPMRDWNTLISVDTLFYYLFWSYLWGIEIELLDVIRAQEKSFDLTYEGLKFVFFDQFLLSFFMFWSYLWGIEMNKAYEDLKVLEKVLILPMRDWNACLSIGLYIRQPRFDLTYEGLKLQLHIPIPTLLDGFDLTYEGLKCNNRRFTSARTFSFWSYLWGIEIPLLS